MDEVTNPKDWDLVLWALYYNGGGAGLLLDEEIWSLYCMADGFGRLPPLALAEINGGWDWSHIRDSSPTAIHEMAEAIRKLRLEGAPS